MGEHGWTIVFEDPGDPDPGREGLREALCALGNGYLMTRGAQPEAVSDGVHRPGTYLAGGYNRAVSRVGGRDVENEDLVNLPNWLPFTFRAADAADWFTGTAAELDTQRTVLDLQHGVLVRDAVVRDADGRTTSLAQRRLVAMHDPHLALLETTLTPLDWEGPLAVRSAVDARVRNDGVARYAGLCDRHVATVGAEAAPGHVLLEVETLASRLRVAVAARTTVTAPPGIDPARRTWTEADRIGEDLTVEVRRGTPCTVLKTVSLHTGRDHAIADPGSAARDRVASAGSFSSALRAHVRRWTRLWARCHLDLGAVPDRATRLYTFHLLQTLTAHTADLDAGVPARGLHGEAYRGHVFWDELFVLPYLDLRLPEVSRGLLRYRHRRLDAARRGAREAGYAGAMFPWQSGSDGREETQTLHLNPRSGRWLPDHSRLQRHVGSAIAYNVWHHYQATGDTGYLADEGAELLVEIARFWASAAQYDHTCGRYRIRGVMGPDEYHDAYPDAEAPGLDDNAYTNVTASWTLRTAAHALDALPEYRRGELADLLRLRREETDRWAHVARGLRVSFHDGVISQFDGYERLAELDWDGYRKRYGDIRRLDRLLEAEGDTVNRYKASKQADVLMLLYLFAPEELGGLFAHLGYRVDADTLQRTADYYLRRTAHGSTLSAVVHAWVLARRDRAGSGRFLREALETDIHDVQGGTTAEGIHLGAMAGSLDLLARGYPGLRLLGDVLELDPVLPEGAGPLDFTLSYRGHHGVRVHVSSRVVRVVLPHAQVAPIRVSYAGTVHEVVPGTTWQAPRANAWGKR